MRYSKQLIIGAILVACAAGVFFGYKKIRSGHNETANKKIYAPVTRGTIDKKIVVAGRVKLTNEQKLRFNVPGRVTKVHFAAGDTVERGQVIAELDKSELSGNMRREQIGLESAIDKLNNIRDKNERLDIEKGENAVTKTKSDLEMAKKEKEELTAAHALDAKKRLADYQRKVNDVADLEKRLAAATDAEEVRRLTVELETARAEVAEVAEKRSLEDRRDALERERKEREIKEMKKNKEEQEDALTELRKNNTYEEELRDARHAVELQRIALRQSETELRKYELVAPFTGVLTKIDFKVGDNLVTDEQKFANLKNPETLTVVTSLDQTEVVQARIGQKAAVTFSALPGKVFAGEVVELEESPKDDDSGATAYEAIVAIDASGEKIYSGMTAKVEIAVERKDHVLVVPLLAVRGEDGTEEGRFVLRKSRDGAGDDEQTPVEVGLSDNINVEIIRGLEEGDEVLEADFEQLESGFGQSSNDPMTGDGTATGL